MPRKNSKLARLQRFLVQVRDQRVAFVVQLVHLVSPQWTDVGRGISFFLILLSQRPQFHFPQEEKWSPNATFQETGRDLGYSLDCGLGGNLGYTARMKEHAVQPAEPAEKRPLYVPGTQGHFITSHELVEWWHDCNCPGQAPALEIGDRWFIDPPMMWEARGETILKRTLHVLPPPLWRHLN